MKSRSLVFGVTAVALVCLAIWGFATLRSAPPRPTAGETAAPASRATPPAAAPAPRQEAASPGGARPPVRPEVAQTAPVEPNPDESHAPAPPRPPFHRSIPALPPPSSAYAPGYDVQSGGDDESTTNVFPWPPPAPSTSYQLPNASFGASGTMGEVAQSITRALESSGYVERRYYKLPVEGLALVTRLERINVDGSPAAPRWLTTEGARPNLYLLVRGLFVTDPGHYRVIVFLITKELPGRKPEDVPIAQAKAWLKGGLDDVPADAGALPYANGRTIAYIYDFVSNGRTFVLDREPLPGKDQLTKAGVLTALGGGGR